jgi:hypothetical protein
LIQILQSQVVFLFVTVSDAAVEVGAGQIVGRFLTRLDERGAAGNAGIGIVGFAVIPILVAGLSRGSHCGAEKNTCVKARLADHVFCPLVWQNASGNIIHPNGFALSLGLAQRLQQFAILGA